jgi:hopanoid-associated phosphorylase
MLLAVTGLRREARIVESGYVRTVSGGGDRANLERLIAGALDSAIRGVVSFGVAGALSPALQPGDCIIASEIVDRGGRLACNAAWQKEILARADFARSGAIAGAETIVASADDKARLFAQTHAEAVDMESHIAARAAEARGLPFVAIRTISDAADRALPPAALTAMRPDGGLDVVAIARSILMRPGQIPDLIRTGRESELAFKALFRCLGRVGPALAFPDIGELVLDMP